MKNLNTRIFLVLAVALIAAIGAFPLQKKISLGLDLQGGTHLVMRVETEKVPEKQREDVVERALEIIRNRVDQFGVKEPLITRQGQDRIVVQLPGITDRQRAIDLIGRTAILEFKMVADEPKLISQALAGTVPEGWDLKEGEGGEKLLIKKEADLKGDTLVDAQVSFDQSRFGEPYVGFTLNDKGAAVFAALTRANIGKRLAIVLDGKVHSAPVIQSEIPMGRGQITGRFTPEQAKDLAIVLRAGALPAPINFEEERTVGPLLGKDSIRSGITAMALGAAAVFFFMTLYYLAAGIIASIALVLNILIILGILGFFHATLTLPGIAGLILTMGMSVDANVLIYERIREELKLGKTLRAAIAAGYQKAFSAILDSNVTTIIAAALLFKFGTGPIRGFAVTLTAGIAASMFTAIIVTRVIFDVLTLNKNFTSLKMLQWFGQTKIDFIKYRKLCFVASLLVIVAGFAIFGMRGQANYGVDFTGGTLQQYHFSKDVEIAGVRKVLANAGFANASIQRFAKSNDIIIRTQEESYGAIDKALKETYADNPPELMRSETVGPTVGRDLKKSAVLSLLWALLGIGAYVTIRFNYKFAAAGVAALFHDVFIVVGALALTHRQFDLTIVAALLTIAGYSINDTIVIFDRIRETSRLTRAKMTFAEIINLSVNQTLSRTILTSLTVFLVVIALYGFGGAVINDFAFSLLIGFISGVYSTVYIASPMLIMWQRKALIKR